MYKIGADYSHVGIIVHYGEITFDSTIYDSTGKGVRASKVEEYMAEHMFRDLIEITFHVNDAQEAIGWLKGNIGKDYSESQYIGFLFPFTKKLVGDGDKEMICSEYVSRFCNEQTKIDAFINLDCDFVCPRTCIETLERYMGL